MSILVFTPCHTYKYTYIFSHVISRVIQGDTDITEKPVDPIKVHSEKELLREFEKIAATLVPEKDWSLRIAAIQRIEALVYGG